MGAMASYIDFGELAAERPYLPFPVAVEQGLVAVPQDPAELDATPPGVEILNGRIPNSKNAGLVPIGGDFAAVDLTLGQLEGSRLLIAPASKDAVSNKGEIAGEGMVTLTEPNGRVRVAALVFDVLSRYWAIENLRRQHSVGVKAGGVAIVAVGWDLPEFEIHDVDSSGGLITAKERRRLF